MPQSCHSHLTRMLREAHAAGDEAAATGMPIDEVTDRRAERARLSSANRREFLKGAGSLLAATAAAGLLRPTMARASTQPRIIIVGGGLAGIRCAHKLWINRGLTSTVYEWDDHVGGRVETLRDFFANGQTTEQHGEFISSEHASMLSLANRYSLALENAQISPPNTSSVYWFNGGYYTQKQLNLDWKNVAWTLFHNAALKAPFPTRYNHYNQTAMQWDQMSVVEWINKYVPGGMSGPFGRLCYEDVRCEYGGPPEQQSALNLIYVLGYDDSASNGYQPRKSPVLAGSDERYHLKGGNDQLIAGMVSELPAGTIQLNQQLMAVKLNSGGTYTCTFQSGATTRDVFCDHIVLAIPFSTLRKVDLSQANLSTLKMRAINNLQLGNNAKIMLQFKSRVWNADGFDGNTFADNGAAATWDTTSYQTGATGILVDFLGGAQGAGLAAKYGLTTDKWPAPTAMVNDILTSIEPIFPGVAANWNGLAYCNDGNINPRLLGAYSQYNVGQYTGFSGIEPVQEGNIHFAGEQTSPNFQGFMEGAVTTGERVAGEI